MTKVIGKRVEGVPKESITEAHVWLPSSARQCRMLLAGHPITYDGTLGLAPKITTASGTARLQLAILALHFSR